jgi:ABC-2 type transport system permease protein
MKMLLFAKRNTKEILREPLNLCFGLGFPLILLVLLSIVNKAIPQEAGNTLFAIYNLAPGLAMFGTAFMSLFAGMLLAKDRTSSFLMRLFTSPMRAVDFLLGYTVPLFLMTAAQVTITLAASLIAGLTLSIWFLLVIPVTMLTSLLFIGLGLLCGSVFSDKAVGGICGALLTNLAGWLSGVFIPLELIGGGFKAFCEALPFWQSVAAIKEALNGNFAAMLPHLGISLAYAVGVYVVATVVFRHKMRSDK